MFNRKKNDYLSLDSDSYNPKKRGKYFFLFIVLLILVLAFGIFYYLFSINIPYETNTNSKNIELQQNYKLDPLEKNINQIKNKPDSQLPIQNKEYKKPKTQILKFSKQQLELMHNRTPKINYEALNIEQRSNYKFTKRLETLNLNTNITPHNTKLPNNLYIHIASLKKNKDAIKLSNLLNQKKINAKIQKHDNYYLVFLGPIDDRIVLNSSKSRLEDMGYKILIATNP